MPVSKYRKEIIEMLKIRAITLYQTGLSYRQIAPIVGKSYNWVYLVMKEFDKNVIQLDKQKEEEYNSK